MKKSTHYRMAELGLMGGTDAARAGGIAPSALYRWLRSGRVTASGEFDGQPAFTAADVADIKAEAGKCVRSGSKPTRVTPALVAEMKRLRALGQKYDDIASAIGCCSLTVSKWLNGEQVGPHRGYLRGEAGQVRIREMVRRRWWGESMASVAREFGVPVQTVAYFCNKHLSAVKFL